MYPVRRQVSCHASALRRDATGAEKIMWQALRNQKLGRWKFRRQWTIGRFIVDFACLDAKLIVEPDGGQHTAENDAARTAFIEQHGFRVIRFWNTDVMANLDGVLEAILVELDRPQKTLTQPSPAKAGEG